MSKSKYLFYSSLGILVMPLLQVAYAAQPTSEDVLSEPASLVPVEEAKLDELRGKNTKNGDLAVVQLSRSDLSQSSSDNMINGDSMTGDNVLTQDALSGNRGSATIIQNTGNQVNIQNSTIYNITLVQ